MFIPDLQYAPDPTIELVNSDDELNDDDDDEKVSWCDRASITNGTHNYVQNSDGQGWVLLNPNGNETPNDTTTLLCPLGCNSGRPYSTARTFKKHIREKHENFVQSLCPYERKSKSDPNKVSLKLYKCPHCPNSYFENKNLKRHLSQKH